MAKFDRYMLSQLTVTFGFFALVLVAVYWVNRAIAIFDRLISDGQTAWVFLQFTALTLPNVILLVLPVAGFVAAIYVTNRMINESEVVVAQAAGLSPFRLARAALVFGLGTTAVMAVLAHLLVPVSRIKIAERQSQIAQDVTAKFLTEGRFLHPAAGLTIYVREITERGELLDVLLNDSRTRDASTLYLAERAVLVRVDGAPRLVMFEGMAQTLRSDGQRLSTVAFKDFSYDLAALIPDARARRPDVRQLSTAALLAAAPADLQRTGKSAAILRAEGHARIAQPLQGLVLALVGVSALMLGRFSRFGVTRQIFLAVLVVIIVQMLTNLTIDVARENAGSWPLLYTPALFGLGAAAVFLWLASYPHLVPRPGRRRPA